jgi:hypothetical protein
MLLCGMGCGRATQDSDGDTAGSIAGDFSASGSGHGGNATSPGGNGPTQGGSAMSHGGTDGGQEVTCEGSGPRCVLSCRSFEGATDASCVGNRYVCPEPWLPFDSCPADACSRRTDNCCAPTGQRTVPNCAADGTIGQCPEGYEVPTGACLPRGLGIQSCGELESGDACTNTALVCYTGKCGRNCACMADETFNLKWNCFAVPC